MAATSTASCRPIGRRSARRRSSRFERKQAPGYRRLGSRLIALVNRRIFAQPPGLTVSNLRILRRDVVDRICDSRTAHPYITGQALMYSRDPADVLVRHDPRPVGTSNYGLTRILGLVFAILFSYSVFPLRAAAFVGFLVAVASFLLGAFYLVRSFVVETQVAGWTTIAKERMRNTSGSKKSAAENPAAEPASRNTRSQYFTFRYGPRALGGRSFRTGTTFALQSYIVPRGQTQPQNTRPNITVSATVTADTSSHDTAMPPVSAIVNAIRGSRLKKKLLARRSESG